MHPLLDSNIHSINRLCHIHGVSRLDAFGSILRNDFDAEKSDIDLLVEFEPSRAADFTNFLDMKDSLEKIFRRPVDLVQLSAVRNRRLRRHIELSKSAIYEAA
jgi:predicted nucleotidyltransferase